MIKVYGDMSFYLRDFLNTELEFRGDGSGSTFTEKTADGFVAQVFHFELRLLRDMVVEKIIDGRNDFE